MAVMEIPSLETETVRHFGMKSALTVAARSISTSDRKVVSADMLAGMLRSGVAPEQFQPQLMALLDKTPLCVVIKAVAEAATPDVPARTIMKNLHHWAKKWKVCRAVW